MSTVSVGGLDGFVDRVRKQGFNHPEVAADLPLRLEYESTIDQELDPFSEQYFSQQVALYEEISGRKLNQGDGELHPEDITPLIGAPNPLGISDVSHVSEHVRALSGMLSISHLGPKAKVLDMGAGHGLSSEVFAFSGCQVHAVDIDPVLSELSTRRSAARGLAITRSTLNYDDLGEIPRDTYEAAFFFQSLHHCLRPWVLIGALKEKIVADGVIAFTGEPIQRQWWKHWGIRLDHESLFVARAYGWFESGWSHEFIRECFERNGLTLMFFSGGHGGGEIGIASSSQRRLDAIRKRAAAIGHSEVMPVGFAEVAPNQYRTQIGMEWQGHGFRSGDSHGGGYLCYGPYLRLKPGHYLVELMLTHDSEESSFVIIDLVTDSGTSEHFRERIDVPVGGAARLRREFRITREAADFEARIMVVGSGEWSCSLPRIRALP